MDFEESTVRGTGRVVAERSLSRSRMYSNAADDRPTCKLIEGRPKPNAMDRSAAVRSISRRRLWRSCKRRQIHFRASLRGIVGYRTGIVGGRAQLWTRRLIYEIVRCLQLSHTPVAGGVRWNREGGDMSEAMPSTDRFLRRPFGLQRICVRSDDRAPQVRQARKPDCRDRC